jgi:hypothetical protein
VDGAAEYCDCVAYQMLCFVIISGTHNHKTQQVLNHQFISRISQSMTAQSVSSFHIYHVQQLWSWDVNIGDLCISSEPFSALQNRSLVKIMKFPVTIVNAHFFFNFLFFR